MKKLLVLFILMGIITVANAQSSKEKDFIMEQVINSVSSLKLSTERAQSLAFTDTDLALHESRPLNPYQYILQPADNISVASTYYGAAEADLSNYYDVKSGCLERTDKEVPKPVKLFVITARDNGQGF